MVRGSETENGAINPTILQARKDLIAALRSGRIIFGLGSFNHYDTYEKLWEAGVHAEPDQWLFSTFNFISHIRASNNWHDELLSMNFNRSAIREVQCLVNYYSLVDQQYPEGLPTGTFNFSTAERARGKRVRVKLPHNRSDQTVAYLPILHTPTFTLVRAAIVSNATDIRVPESQLADVERELSFFNKYYGLSFTLQTIPDNPRTASGVTRIITPAAQRSKRPPRVIMSTADTINTDQPSESPFTTPEPKPEDTYQQILTILEGVLGERFPALSYKFIVRRRLAQLLGIADISDREAYVHLRTAIDVLATKAHQKQLSQRELTLLQRLMGSERAKANEFLHELLS